MSTNAEDVIVDSEVDVDDDARQLGGELADVGVVIDNIVYFDDVVSGASGEETAVAREAAALNTALTEREGVRQLRTIEDTNGTIGETDG